MGLNNRGKAHIYFSRSLYIYFALLLITIPVRLLFAAAISAAVHELFHIAAIRIMRIEVYSIHLGISGAKIETEPMTYWQELFCALSGPLGGFLLFCLIRWMPIIAITGAIQSLYNLLPLYPMDGGRALMSGMKLLFPGQNNEKAMYAIEIITLCIITAFCVFLSFWFKLGIVPILLAASLLFKASKRK